MSPCARRRCAARSVLRRVAGMAVVVAVSAGAAAPCGAVSTETWRVSGRDAFLAAHLESLSVSSDGVVTLAPAFEAVEGLDAAYVWCLAVAPDGTLRAGTGNSGALFTVAGGQARRLHDGVALENESLVFGRDGTLYVGSAPDATILAVAPDGTARVFADLPERHVWGLLLEPSGSLLAATGERARIYRIDAAGNPSPVYEGSADHFTCLARREGEILAGTDGDGLLLAIASGGKARVLLDAAEPEIKALAVAPDGTIYAAANPGPGEVSREGAGKGGNRPTIYRVLSNGVVEPIWTCPDATIHAILLAPDGSLLAGTGDGEAGGVYRVEADGQRWSLLGRPGPPQVLSLGLAGEALLVGTGSPGRVYRGALRGSPVGTLLSEVRDVKQVADWGVLRWERVEGDGGGILFRTRSGNSGQPDATWSDWSAPLSEPDGSSVTSPAGRFIQWEAAFQRGSSGSPALREVTVAYAEKNLAPVIRSLEFSAAGAPLARGGDSSGPQPVVQTLPGNVRAEYSVSAAASRGPASDEEAAWARRYRTIRWEAADPNEDLLVYRLEYRARGEEGWRLIEKRLEDAIYTWDTARVPDGHYWLRVIASDEAQNMPGEERTATRESRCLVVDNTPPTVEGLAATLDGGRLKVTARLADGVGPLKKAELALDGGEWRVVQPLDRVFDEAVEEVSVDVEVAGAGEHQVLLRVSDQAGNVGVGRASVEAGRR